MAATLVSLNKVLDEFFGTTRNYDKKNALSLKLCTKRTIQDLKLNILSKTKKKFVKVKQTNGFRYVEMPSDYYMFGSAAVVDDRKRIQPLSKNEFLNITEEVIEEDCEDRKCKKCGQVASEICFETAHFEAVTEDVTIPNTITTLCDYTANFLTVAHTFPYTVYGISSSGGFSTINTVVNNQGELDNVMDAAGFTKISSTKYKVSQTAVIYDFLYLLTNAEVPLIEIITLAVDNCNQDDSESTTYPKVTTLKVCANGDIVREVCEPVVINTPDQTLCDYHLNLSFDKTLCEYSIQFSPPLQQCDYCLDINALTYPINNATVTIAGTAYNSGVLANVGALAAWLVSLGFNDDNADGIYCIENTVGVVGILYVNYVANLVTVNPVITGCDTASDRYPYWIYGYTKNGSYIEVNAYITDYADLVAFFVSIGFTENAFHVFLILNSADVFNSITYSIYAPNTIIDSTTVDFVQSNCDDTLSIVPPFMLKSYTKNLVVTTVNTAITTNAQMISVFAALGIYLSADGEFMVYQSSDIWNSIIITYNGTDFVFNFTSQNCFTTTTHVVENVCNTVTECNVEVLSCGCIKEDVATCQKIELCCRDILSCCHGDNIKHLANDFPYPESPNPNGGFKWDEDTNRVYLDDYFCGDKVLMTYKTDGSINGKYFIPDYSVEAALAGIYWRSVRFDKRIALGEKSYAKREYASAKDTLFRELNPFSLGELSRALQSMVFWVAPLMRSSRQLFFNRTVSNHSVNQ